MGTNPTCPKWVIYIDKLLLKQCVHLPRLKILKIFKGGSIALKFKKMKWNETLPKKLVKICQYSMYIAQVYITQCKYTER